jgi:hypothetical protein
MRAVLCCAPPPGERFAWRHRPPGPPPGPPLRSATVLDVLEGLLGCGEALVAAALLPLLPELLAALHAAIQRAWAAPTGGRVRLGGRARGEGVRLAAVAARMVRTTRHGRRPRRGAVMILHISPSSEKTRADNSTTTPKLLLSPAARTSTHPHTRTALHRL